MIITVEMMMKYVFENADNVDTGAVFIVIVVVDDDDNP